MNLLVVSHPCVVDVNQRVYHELELDGHDVSIVVPDRWRHEYSARDFRPARLAGFTGPLIPLRVCNPGSVPLHAYFSRLVAVLARVAPDVVYIEEEPYSVAAFQWTVAASRSRLRTVFFSAQNIVKKYPLPFRLSERYVWNRSSAGVCVTASVAQALVRRGYRGQTCVVPHAVDVSTFAVRPTDANLRRELGLRALTIAYLGRLVVEKGVRVLLDAYRHLPMRESTSLLFIGSGPLADECRAESGTVLVEGIHHSEVPRHLALADLVVVPSLTTSAWKEQFGRAVIEAMACGLPVIGSDSGEIPNLVNATGGGVIVPEGDAVALRDALGPLLQDANRRRQLGEHGRRHVQATYSTSAIAHRLATALRLQEGG